MVTVNEALEEYVNPQNWELLRGDLLRNQELFSTIDYGFADKDKRRYEPDEVLQAYTNIGDALSNQDNWQSIIDSLKSFLSTESVKSSQEYKKAKALAARAGGGRHYQSLDRLLPELNAGDYQSLADAALNYYADLRDNNFSDYTLKLQDETSSYLSDIEKRKILSRHATIPRESKIRSDDINAQRMADREYLLSLSSDPSKAGKKIFSEDGRAIGLYFMPGENQGYDATLRRGDVVYDYDSTNPNANPRRKELQFVDDDGFYQQLLNEEWLSRDRLEHSLYPLGDKYNKGLSDIQRKQPNHLPEELPIRTTLEYQSPTEYGEDALQSEQASYQKALDYISGLKFNDVFSDFTANLKNSTNNPSVGRRGGAQTAYTGSLASASGYQQYAPNQEFANVFNQNSQSYKGS